MLMSWCVNKFVTFTIQKGVTKRKAYCFYSPATKTMRKKITNGWLIDWLSTV